MIKSIDFINIQGWMISELKLTGNPLIVYAIIFGFSRLQGHTFFGSRSYIAAACGISIRSVQTILDSLVEKQYIMKADVMRNNVRYCEYQVDLEILDEFDVTNFTGGEGTSRVVKELHGSSEGTSPNNKDINKTVTGKEKKEKKEKLIKTTLDEDFSVSESMLKWALDKFPNLDPKWIIEETENFKDYYIAKQSEWADWLRVWQKWIRKSNDKVFIEKKENPPSDSAESPPTNNPDFIKGTQIEKFERNPDGSFNRKKYSKEAMSYIRKNHKNLIDSAYVKNMNMREKLTEHEAMLLEKNYEEYSKHWDDIQEAKKGNRK